MVVSRAVFAAFAFVGAWVAFAPTAYAGPTLFETADGSLTTQGVLIDDDAWLMHRFEVTSPVQLETVGGVFFNFDSAPATLFGAVVGLSGSADLPNSNDLSTGDLLGTTLLSSVAGLEFFGAEASGSISLNLTAGWYGLVFGSGAFGASSGPDIDLGMPRYTNDLAPLQDPVSLFQPSHPTMPNQISIQLIEPRFFATIVPEPASWVLTVTGLAACTLLLRGMRGRKRRKL